MGKVKAHIVFDEKKVAKPEARAKMLDKIKKTANISDINAQRFELYGVLTGNVEESNLEKVRQIPGVASVEVDKEKYLQ